MKEVTADTKTGPALGMIRLTKRKSLICFPPSPGDCCQVVSQQSSSPSHLPVGLGWHEKAFLNAATWT